VADIQIDTRALAQMNHELKLFAPDLKKELDKRLRKIGNAIAKDAKGRTPQRTGRARASIKTRVRNRGDDLIVSVMGRTQLLEFAENGHSPQGKSLVQTLDSRYGQPGRFLWDAYDRNKPEPEIEQAIREVSREFESRIRRF
jgi:hypothetical protein